MVEEEVALGIVVGIPEGDNLQDKTVVKTTVDEEVTVTEHAEENPQKNVGVLADTDKDYEIALNQLRDMAQIAKRKLEFTPTSKTSSVLAISDKETESMDLSSQLPARKRKPTTAKIRTEPARSGKRFKISTVKEKEVMSEGPDVTTL